MSKIENHDPNDSIIQKIRERNEYLDLLDGVFCQFCGKVPDDEWLDDNALSVLEDISDVLVKNGRIERHPSNKRLYRRDVH